MAGGDFDENQELHDPWFIMFMATAPDDEHEPGPIDYERFWSMWDAAWPTRRTFWQRLRAWFGR
jgi:hypothetical protein